MSEKASRIILSIEAVVLCLPITLLFLVFGTLAVTSIIPGQQGIWKAYLGFGFVFIALFSAWRLMLSFIFGGKEYLNALSFYDWVISLLATCIILGSTLYIFIINPSDDDPAFSKTVIWGLPFIVPFLHLGIERYARLR